MFRVTTGRAICIVLSGQNVLKQPVNLAKNVARGLTTKRFYEERKNKPPPFPYERLKYTGFQSLFDPTKRRFDENSKVIIIEGPVASGKKELAKYVAEEFGLKYIAPWTSDIMYINDYGFDLRDYRYQMPESLCLWDEKLFNTEPFHYNNAGWQANKYRLRYSQYYDVMTHIMNTGQGVVTVRSPFSDFVFADAMFHAGYIGPAARGTYYKLVDHSLFTCWRPHVIIYLDVPVDKTIENIKKRGIDHEVNGTALSPEFLEAMEKRYKERYLVDASYPSEVLIYDWSEGGEPEVVVEDLERIKDFEVERNREDPKYQDWRQDEWYYDLSRIMYHNHRNMHMWYLNIMDFSAPEMFSSGTDDERFQKVVNNAPGHEYDVGYNPLHGDKNLVWKWKTYKDFNPMC